MNFAAVVPLLALVWQLLQPAPLAWKATHPTVDHRAVTSSSARATSASLCTLVPGTALAFVRVERDTMLPHGPTGAQPRSATGLAPDPRDTLVATPETPMPAAVVRLLRTDSATRAALEAAGVRDEEPAAWIRAAPYRADCRTIRYTDTIPFAVPGELGYIRAYLSPREQWIDGRPVLVIPDVWNYPYPRRRGLAVLAPPDLELAPAEAVFGFEATIELPRAQTLSESQRRTVTGSARALEWARRNTAVAELEPLNTLVRRHVLAADWETASSMPSRLRGSYRVDVNVNGRHGTWFFRTHDRPGYRWHGPPPIPTIAELVGSPFTSGYRLVGYAAASHDSLPPGTPQGVQANAPLVWLAVTDRPTAPGNEDRTELAGMLEFRLAGTPESMWDDLEAFVPPMSRVDSVLATVRREPFPRSWTQPRLPLTIRLDPHGGVRADTVLVADGRTLRISLERMDTLSLRRPY